MPIEKSRLSRFGLAVAVVLAAGAVFAGACNDDDNDVDATPTVVVETPVDGAPNGEPPGDTNGDDENAVFRIAEHPDLGQILTDAEGFTLYTFAQDSAGQSSCFGDCETVWPPAAVSEVTAMQIPAGEAGGPSGATGAVDTIFRPDATTDPDARQDEITTGAYQLTYDGIPLYRYALDSAPGDASGHEVGGNWFVATP
jgi:predicted lipoprotein with Yx(FWY)xxD motif